MGEAQVGAHGIIMIIAFLFMTQFAEVIAWWATNKVRMLREVEGCVWREENKSGANTTLFLFLIV